MLLNLLSTTARLLIRDKGLHGAELWSVDDGPEVLRLLDLLVQKYISGYAGQELWSVHDGQQVLELLDLRVQKYKY